ncbi:MAG: bifunctional folylpolyglutamate synthase/dihydrofolate synthase [Bacteroidales bacterium]|jgi:dihydrofolate synthase/folylpolyglutamate synthase|nr:bifunctional folylpolyglutamate synthase/dihydrofolate synthase [Bacteroidales bacterium]
MRTYEEIIENMFAALPMFQRIGAAAYKPDLSRTVWLMNLFDNPQNKFKSVHVAGTNGKGSCSHSIAAVLQVAGYKTGLFTSPHLKDFRERIRINGEMIPKEKVVNFYECHKDLFDAEKISFFEMTTALAFDYFAQEKVDMAVVEVGMGGRLDSTNTITPELSIITNISLDHTQFLGDTLQKIASEKAGIIKDGVQTVIGETQPETAPIFIEKASEIIFADREYTVIPRDGAATNSWHFDVLKNKKLLYENIKSDLSGISYQRKNMQTILCSLELLAKKFKRINEKAIRSGLENVTTLTGLKGRWQILPYPVLTIADTGHNFDGIALTLEQIAATPHKNLHIVWGMVSDKDISHILEILPKNATYYFCCPPLPRGLNETELKKQAQEKNLHGNAYQSVQQALQQALKNATPADLIYIGGSNFVVAEVV